MSLPVSQSVLDQGDIMFGKRQRFCQHGGIVLTVPYSFHYTGFRMLVSALQNVSDFVRQDVAKQSRSQGLIYHLEAIGKNFDLCPLKGECLCECLGMEGRKVAVSEHDLNRVQRATAVAKPLEPDSDPLVDRGRDCLCPFQHSKGVAPLDTNRDPILVWNIESLNIVHSKPRPDHNQRKSPHCLLASTPYARSGGTEHNAGKVYFGMFRLFLFRRGAILAPDASPS
jgi:hypothetical protein